MGARLHRAELRELLRQRDYETILSWAGSVRNPQRILISLTFERDELLRWRAIDAFGRVAAVQAELGLEKVRDTLRRLLWLMNDESGGLGWHAPEMIAETLVNAPVLISEFAGLLPSYLAEEPFERGAHFAIYRVAQLDARPFVDHVPALTASLNDPDPAIRAYSALALETISGSSDRDAIRELRTDNATFMWFDFDTGELRETTVGGILGELCRK
jgi:hypothetical protein